ncbi:hypothetical protein QJS10_CPA06g01264 [Acorus calamus]|uniref:Transmembrane protein n=1 Tax=Acorus calamus TaxID=4465 RepID=A0AAV9ELG2_ACOCL|nr:hypothetical protein QJS10_CPA06g01264 [Acorus calamus]
MVSMSSFLAMSAGAFLFWKSMDKLHVYMTLHYDEKQEAKKKVMEIRRMREELLAQSKRDATA